MLKENIDVGTSLHPATLIFIVFFFAVRTVNVDNFSIHFFAYSDYKA